MRAGEKEMDVRAPPRNRDGSSDEGCVKRRRGAQANSANDDAAFSSPLEVSPKPGLPLLLSAHYVQLCQRMAFQAPELRLAMLRLHRIAVKLSFLFKIK